ncbi:lipoprotein [Spiroplasma mirum]|nr:MULTISPECIES: lipoprotein [Spiroplasma]AHF61007.1 hypothetical protein SMM_0582 [Spiroplasma mirum ATCC 29335]AKM53110.1 hypothetical protein SATRI_v1c06380 [Spiroplasma atrichopogonis]
MKRLLSIIAAITLIGTSSTNLVACNRDNKVLHNNHLYKQWKGTDVDQQFFRKNYDGKTYLVISNNVLSPNNSWHGSIIAKDTPKLNNFVLEPNWKVYIWTSETDTPFVPNIDKTNGNIIKE